MGSHRDRIDVDILCVGAGVATLSAVLRLLKRVAAGGDGGRGAPRVMVVEKGREVGAHVLSGCVMDPEPLGELLTPDEMAALPVESRVRSEAVYYLTCRRAWRIPWVPRPMRSHGMPLVALSRLTRHLGGLCEAAGADVCTEVSAVALLREGGRVAGVRLGDKGLDRDGRPKTPYEPGADVGARVVVLGEGAAGCLTATLLAGSAGPAPAHPATYALGIKELLETPPAPDEAGHILHTVGFPHDARTYGGGFLYRLNATRVAVGLVTALDYRDAALDPHGLFREFKSHPLIRSRLRGGVGVGYGAKMLPESGLRAVPPLVADGALIVGDAAGLLNSVRLKGVHIAVQSGIAAGDALYEAWWRGDFSRGVLQSYPDRLRAMSGWREMWRVRHVRAAFRLGRFAGMGAAGMSLVTGGLFPFVGPPMKPDADALRPQRVGASARPRPTLAADPGLAMDRLSDLFHSGIRHREDQPCHVKIRDADVCRRDCLPRFAAPCTRFCPAEVYALKETGDGIRIDASNCLHCRTCQVKDPFRNIEWALPEGGGGPRYERM